jgi:hypothetical protein
MSAMPGNARAQGLMIAARENAVVKRRGKGHKQHAKHRDGEPADATMGPVAQLALAFEHEPAGAEQRVAAYQADPRQDRKWVQPAKRAAGVLAFHHRNTADHGADRGALRERDHDRTKKEPPPQIGPQQNCPYGQPAPIGRFGGKYCGSKEERPRHQGPRPMASISISLVNGLVKNLPRPF